MQKYFRLIGLLVVLLCFYRVQAQIKETDVFLKRVILVFKNQDEKGFVQLYPSKEKFKKILLTMMKAQAGNDSANINRGMAMLASITDSSLYNEFATPYRKTMEKSKAKKLDWSKATFSSYIADTTIVAEVKGKQLKGKILFQSGNKDYFLVFTDVFWPDGEDGWYGIVIKNIGEVGKDNEDEPEGDSMALPDSATVATDTAKLETVVKPKPVKVLKPAPKTNKTKLPAGKITPKIKPVALKPGNQ